MKSQGFILGFGVGATLLAVAQTPSTDPVQKNLVVHPTPVPLSEDEARAALVRDWTQRLASGDTTAHDELQAHHSSEFNCAVAWKLYNLKQLTLARDLFLEALTWNPGENQARQGLYYTYKLLGDQKSAIAYITFLPQDQQAREYKFQIQSQPRTQSPPQTQPQPQTDSQTLSDSQTQSEPQTRSQPQIQSQPQTQLQPVTQTQPQTQLETPTESQPEPHNYPDADHPRRPTGGDFISQAVRYNQDGQYDKALAALSKGEAQQPLDRGLRLLRAWIYFHKSKFADAKSQFEQLYRAHQDADTAQGLYLSAQRLGQLNSLRSDPVLRSGPMAALLYKSQGQEFYDDADYLAAYQAAPQIDLGLKNIDSPWVGAGTVYRHKDGTAGLGRVDEELFPEVEGGVNIDPVDQLHVSISRLTLDSGKLNDSLQYGTAPIVPTPRKFDAITDYPELLLPNIDFHHDGFTAINASLGLTPLNAVIAPLPTGKVEVVQQMGGSFVSAAVFSKSDTESLLAYAGARDPYTGITWGRVVEAGARANGFLDLGHNWGAYGEGSVSELVGDHVEDNGHLAVSLNLSRNFDVPGFQYLAIGPDFSFDHFERNESEYTYGQGGYFSPDALAEGGLALSFLTKESRRFLADGYAAAGAQTNHQQGSYLLPLSPDVRSYPGTSDSSMVFAFHARMAYLLTEHWQLGGFFSYGKSADYNEAMIGLNFRYYFDPRVALFRNDLPSMAY